MMEVKQKSNTWGLQFTQVDVESNEIKKIGRAHV